MIGQGFGRHAGARVAGQKATGVRRVKGGISRAMRAIRRVLVVVLGGLLILATILLGGGYLWMRGSLPKTAGEVRIAALEAPVTRSEEHTSELQSLMRISYAVFCLKKKTNNQRRTTNEN